MPNDDGSLLDYDILVGNYNDVGVLSLDSVTSDVSDVASWTYAVFSYVRGIPPH
jgi:hypothetical protein